MVSILSSFWPEGIRGNVDNLCADAQAICLLFCLFLPTVKGYELFEVGSVMLGLALIIDTLLFVVAIMGLISLTLSFVSWLA